MAYIRPSKPNKAKQLDLRKALEKANFHLSSPEIDDDMFVNNSDDNSSVDDNVQEDCLSGDNIKDLKDVELIDYSVINKSKSSSPICSLEKVGSGQLVIDTFIEEIMEMAIHEVKHILDTESAIVAESTIDGILTKIWMRDTQLTIADEAIVENEIIEDDSEIIFKSEALQISENIVYDIFESFKVRESPCSHDFCIGKKTSIKEDEIRIQDNSSFTFEENHIANECEQSEKITKNELLSRTNAECTNNSQENISNDNQTETKYISESNSQQDLSAGVKENEESTEITSEKGKHSRKLLLN